MCALHHIAHTETATLKKTASDQFIFILHVPCNESMLKAHKLISHMAV